MKRHRLIINAIIILLSGCHVLSSVTYAQPHFYRFADQHGVITLSRVLPPHIIKNGYDVIDTHTMQVLETVPAQSTITDSQTEHSSQNYPEKRKRQLLGQRFHSIKELQQERSAVLSRIHHQIQQVEQLLKHQQQRLNRTKLQRQQLSMRYFLQHLDHIQQDIVYCERKLYQLRQGLHRKQQQYARDEKQLRHVLSQQ